MSYVTTITVFLIMLSNQLSANNWEGQMDCKVKTNPVILIEEGIGKEFTGFSDSFSTGDELRLTYTVWSFRVVVVPPAFNDYLSFA